MDTTSWIGQVSVGVASGLIVLLAQAFIDRTKGPANAAGMHIGHTVSTTQVQINIAQSVTQLPPTSRVRSGEPAGPGAVIVGALVTIVVSAALFLHLHPYLFALSIGIAAALLAGAIYASFRTTQLLGRWPAPAVVTAIETVASTIVTVAVWIGVYTSSRGNMSLTAINAATTQPAPDGPEPLWVRSLMTLPQQASTMVEVYGMEGAYFIAFLVLAVLASNTLLILTAAAVFDWLSYIRLAQGVVPRAFIVRRAARFGASQWGYALAFALVAALAVAGSTGWFFDLASSTPPLPNALHVAS
ncbi:hypothetical protein [Microbacterium sp. SORGH_AS_0862]|uniref:hypothetical protein n=1 Tax=Microbacterium sp. SORGH_AS_0862 TaxID=3041789 RepID=UPI002792737A|nr:hypothetical protein [Microbacterium sp. SORGH_AS_0862]MDQ1204485.1 hypothetical protein [Microbacterium sp. SORGH_AS_0862]